MSNRVLDIKAAITCIKGGIDTLLACKIDDVIYGISDDAMAICIAKDGKLYIGSPLHAAPAAEVEAIIGRNMIRNGLGHEARKMSRLGLIQLAVDMAQETLVTLDGVLAEALAAEVVS